MAGRSVTSVTVRVEHNAVSPMLDVVAARIAPIVERVAIADMPAYDPAPLVALCL